MGLCFGHLRNYVGEKVDWFDRIKGVHGRLYGLRTLYNS